MRVRLEELVSDHRERRCLFPSGSSNWVEGSGLKRFCSFVTSERVCGNPDQIRVCAGFERIWLDEVVTGSIISSIVA